MSDKTQITCPNCGVDIDVNDLLMHQLEAPLKKAYQEKLNQSQEALRAQKIALEAEQRALKAQQENETKRFEEQLKTATKLKEHALETALKEKLAIENAEVIAQYQKELKIQSEKIQTLSKNEVEIQKLIREKSEMKITLEAENLKQLNEQLGQAREQIKKQEAEQSELKIKELVKQLDDQKKLTEEMRRKQDQGSMQLQGEVQELAIEAWLATTFPLDTIDEIRKGTQGADCLQIINTREQQNCGAIYYESKRTKSFQPAWIEKFKTDIRERTADIGVIVTEAMPVDMVRMGLKEGIWICTYEEFKALSAVLRHSIIQYSHIVNSQENKGEKMAMLYDFLTGNEFKLRIEGIVEGFSQMQEDLDKEKRAMKRLWAQREKQIEKVIDNTLAMYGSIKGIAGNALKPIQALELDTHHITHNDQEP